MHPRGTEAGTSQGTKMESVLGDKEGQRIKFQERNTKTDDKDCRRSRAAAATLDQIKSISSGSL